MDKRTDYENNDRWRIGEFKAHFAEVVEQVKSGIGVAVTYGRKKEIVGYFLPKSGRFKNKRKLGLLNGKARATFKPDFKITEEEFSDELFTRLAYFNLVSRGSEKIIS